MARLAPAIEPWLAGRTVVVAAHEPVLLPPFDATVALPGDHASRSWCRREPPAGRAAPCPRRTRARPTGGSPWPGCSGWPRRPPPSACWPVRATSWAGPRCARGSARSSASSPPSRCWPSCAARCATSERLVGHDAALRALTRWRVWLYDCLTPRVPAALAGWRSGDLLVRAIDDVDTLQDLYLRTVLPVGDRRRRRRRSARSPSASSCRGPPSALGLPLAVALVVPALLTWRRSGDDEIAALSGALSAQVVDALERRARAAGLRGRRGRARRRRGAGRPRRRARAPPRRAWPRPPLVVIGLCLAAAVLGVLALGVAAVHDHHLGQVMVAVLPLAALATFETVPGRAPRGGPLPGRAGRGRRLFALEDVPVPVRRPDAPEARAPGVPDVTFARTRPCATDRGSPAPSTGSACACPPGGRLAVTGSSGAGKSSLVTALLRFWPLEAGTLSLGGTDVERLAQADARAACALADQRAQMFAGTLRSNLTLGRPDASDDAIADALRAARLDGWVASLPDGLDTPVGEDGVALSGGERRRLAVARALLAPGPSWSSTSPPAGSTRGWPTQLIDGRAARRRGPQRAGHHPPGRRGGALRRRRTLEAGRGRGR